jgi:hypothetical protein
MGGTGQLVAKAHVSSSAAEQEAIGVLLDGRVNRFRWVIHVPAWRCSWAAVVLRAEIPRRESRDAVS